MAHPVNIILDELIAVFDKLNTDSETALVDALLSARKIVCGGAGRVGLSVAGFAKRLTHLGREAHWIGDVTLPRTGPEDFLFLASGSGETETVVILGEIAKRQGLGLGLITTNQSSTLAKLADVVMVLDCPNKYQAETGPKSSQPMTSLFEQACQLYLDGLVIRLMERTGTSEEEMKARHNVIE